MTTSTPRLDIEGLVKAADRALRRENWAGVGIPSMSIHPNTILTLVDQRAALLRAAKAVREHFNGESSDEDWWETERIVRAAIALAEGVEP